jgi:pimeloyl-ACP methyl ester carboxylesterase
VTPFAVDTTYEPFATAVLARDDFGHSNFPYDWRKPFSASAIELRNAVLTAYKGLNLGDASGKKRIHIVAHSMGGLVVRAALMDFGKDLWPVVGRIVFIGTPHYGSPAIAGYLKNHLWGFNEMALLGMYLKRETFRSLWGVLQLLPAPSGIYPGTRPADNPPWRATASEDWFYEHPCANFDIYDAGAWGLDLDSVNTKRLQTLLDAAKDFHTRLHSWHNTLNADQRDRMLIIAGVGYKTLFRLEYKSKAFGLWESMNKITDRVKSDPHREGDGRVPLASATLDKISICFIKGVHGGLTNIPDVYSGVFDWLNGQPVNLPDTVNRALAEHLSPGSASEAPHLDGTVRTVQDDPGYWDLSMPYPPALEELNRALDTTGMPSFHHVRLL